MLLIKILLVVVELLLADRQAGKHDKANRHTAVNFRCEETKSVGRFTCSVTLYVIGSRKSVMQFDSERALLWRLDATGSSKTRVGFHVHCPILTKLGFS
jgi:hypothetical protein